jgi:hypothetical protein
MTARALYFKGVYEGEKGAKQNYLNARPADDAINNYKLPPDVAKRVKREDHSRIEATQILVLRRAKQDASFWLGLVCFEQRDYPVAVDYFAVRTLQASPRGPWTPAARYNLARAYEAMGKIDQAIDLYESDTSQQSHGNKLRARRLRQGGSTAARAVPDAHAVASP